MSSDFDDLRRAAEKLICLFIEHAVKGDDVKLHHILTVENIEVVAKLTYVPIPTTTFPTVRSPNAATGCSKDDKRPGG